MPAFDSEQWSRLSPLLDELLELDEAARAALLAGLRRADPALAATLEALLSDVEAIRRDAFLEGGTPLAPRDAVAIGRVVGAYTLERELGAGGMGSVWLARRSDGRFEGVAAVKLPHIGLLSRGGAERFAREALLLGRLAHPNIAALLDAGVTADGQPYLIIESVEGETIDRWCDHRSASVETRVRLFLDVLAAVAHAHHRLVLHRDLKPGNILVTAEGRVKLLDFGIAKLLEADEESPQATMPLFTPDYAAPEQLQGGELTTATDVYALGVLLYELLCGVHPTAGRTKSRLERMRAVVETEAPRLSATAARVPPTVAERLATTPARAARRLRGDLDTIVAKALKKVPGERYPTAAAMADDLRRHLDGVPVGAASATVLALLAGVAATSWQAYEARRERDEARHQAERALAHGELVNLMLGAMGSGDRPLTQRQILEEAVRLVDQRYGDKPGIAVELLLPIAGQYHTLDDIEKDYEVMRRAATFAAASGDANLVAQVACDTVNTHLVSGRVEQARAQLLIGMQALKQSTRPRLGVETDCLMAAALVDRDQGDLERALERVSLAVQRAEAAGDTGGNIYPSMLSLKGLLQEETGALSSALLTQERLIALHGAAGRTLDALATRRNAAIVMMDMGEYAAAKASVDDVLAHWPGGAGDPVPPYLQLTQAMLLLRFDDFAGAGQVLAAMRRHAQAHAETALSRWIAFFDAQAAIGLGHLDDADRLLREVQASPLRLSARYRVITPVTVRALLLMAHGDAAAASHLVEEELLRLDPKKSGDAIARASCLRAASRIALAAGEATRGEVHAIAALAAARKLAREPARSADVGESQLLLAQAQLALGRRREAVDTAAQAAAALTAGLSASHPLARMASAIAEAPRP